MASVIKCIISGFVICILLSFKIKSSSDIFLSLDYKGKVSIYNTPTKQKVIKEMRHNFKEEDYLVFTIYNSNDSMYFVDAGHALKTDHIKGWISKKNKLATFSGAYTTKLILYSSFNKKSIKASLNYIADELDILDYNNGWLKVKVRYNHKEVIGWIPPESQCGNPYTTCS